MARRCAPALAGSTRSGRRTRPTAATERHELARNAAARGRDRGDAGPRRHSIRCRRRRSLPRRPGPAGAAPPGGGARARRASGAGGAWRAAGHRPPDPRRPHRGRRHHRRRPRRAGNRSCARTWLDDAKLGDRRGQAVRRATTPARATHAPPPPPPSVPAATASRRRPSRRRRTRGCAASAAAARSARAGGRGSAGRRARYPPAHAGHGQPSMIGSRSSRQRPLARSTRQRRLRLGHERHAVAREPRRHRAVERVDPQLDAADEVVDLADPEQVARAVLGQLLAVAQPTTSYICGLVRARASRRSRSRRSRWRRPPGPTPGAGPRRRRPGRSRRRAWPVGPCSACQSRQRSQPAVGALGRARGVVAADVERRALVEGERDVGAERRLHLHRGLGRDEALAAVDVGAEAHALLLDREDRAGALRRPAARGP